VRANDFSVAHLDRWISYAVVVLHGSGIRTYESCQGGTGHAFPEPTVRFEGTQTEAFRAVSVARAHGLPVQHLRRFWRLTDSSCERPAWELTFFPREMLERVQVQAETAGYPVNGVATLDPSAIKGGRGCGSVTRRVD
jgi:hypothetical protein